MKYCPAIVGLKLDEKSLIAIDNINDIHNVMKLGKVTILIGQLLSIFAGNAVKTSSSGIRLMEDTLAWRVVSSNQSQNGWAITQSNWEYFFSSFGVRFMMDVKLNEEYFIFSIFSIIKELICW